MTQKAEKTTMESKGEEEEDYDVIDGVPVPKDVKEQNTEERKKVATELYENGVKWNDITKATGLNPKTIMKAIKQAGITKRTGKESKDEGRKEEKEAQPKQRTVVRGAVPPLKILDEGYATALTHLTTKMDWFSEVMMEIGFSSTLMAFQSAKIPIDDAFDKIGDFRDDAGEFITFVQRYLRALWKAKDEAGALVALEEDLEKARMKLYMTLQAVNSLKSQRDEWHIKAKMALSCLDETGLRRYAFSTTFSETETQSLPVEATKKEIELE